ncbi:MULTISPECIES: hypothetical protein [unclassified Streptomyces]|uniref:hypothetical protein n=1 Tax=unclassified Streptomyces TaxID=2593676 RepID=UPI000CD58C4E|nr:MULTISPECIES: hypothetical protein [unclassified Streptomyces]
MGEFVSAALDFPAVVFTFPLLVVIAYWLFAAVTGLAGEIFDADTTDASDSGGAAGGFAGFMTALGLGGVPVTVVLSLVIAVAWFVCLVGTVLFDHTLVRFGFLLLALYIGWHVTWLLAKPLRRMLHTTSAGRNADFVGLVCEVRVGCAPGRFGQGLVTAADGGTALIDIRSEEPEPIPAGSHALIYDYDAEADFFRVAPAGAAADPLG